MEIQHYIQAYKVHLSLHRARWRLETRLRCFADVFYELIGDPGLRVCMRHANVDSINKRIRYVLE